MRIEYHRTLIADKVRNDAFQQALSRVIEPGETIVADIGAGTGLLGLMAEKLGAKEVYLYEKGEVANVAAETLRKNRARGCQIFPCDSREMGDPPRVDVVVSETLGNYALEENIISTLADARARHLKPGGRIIPARIDQWVAPVISNRFHLELCAWDEVGQGLDLSAAKSMSFNNVYVRHIAARDLFDQGASAQLWDSVDFNRETRANRKGEARWKLDQKTEVFGFALWWTAELVEGVSLSTAPDAPATHWEQLYFPLSTPIVARSGEAVMVSLRSRTSEETGTHLAWTGIHLDAEGKVIRRQMMDLDKGWIP